MSKRWLTAMCLIEELADEFHDEITLGFFCIMARHRLNKSINWSEATSDYLEEISKTIAEELLKVVDMEK